MSKGTVNKAIVIGNLGADPEIRYMQNGDAVATLSIATVEAWKDAQGQPQERSEWHRVTLYRKLAEIAGQYLKKGAKVYIEGRLQTRKWQDKTGQDRYTTEIIVNEMQMLGGNPGQGDSGQGQRPQGQQRPQQRQAEPEPQHGGMPDFDTDIPF